MLDSMMDSGDKLFQVAKFASKPGFRELIQKEIVFIEIPVVESDSFRIPGKRLTCIYLFESLMIFPTYDV